MFVIWKRPDGFHNADPSDFLVAQVGSARLWLHKTNHNEYPFRVSGGWEEDTATKLLNNLVNLMPCNDHDFVERLVSRFEHSTKSNPAEFVNETVSWLRELKSHLKGDTWEVEIMKQAFTELEGRLIKIKESFIKRMQP